MGVVRAMATAFIISMEQIRRGLGVLVAVLVVLCGIGRKVCERARGRR